MTMRKPLLCLALALAGALVANVAPVLNRVRLMWTRQTAFGG